MCVSNLQIQFKEYINVVKNKYLRYLDLIIKTLRTGRVRDDKFHSTLPKKMKRSVLYGCSACRPVIVRSVYKDRKICMCCCLEACQ